MTHLLSAVALCGAASAGTIEDETTLGIRYELPEDPDEHEARERGRPQTRRGAPASRPHPAARPAARPARSPARPAPPRSVPSTRTPPGGPAHRPAATRPVTHVPPGTAVGTRPGAVAPPVHHPEGRPGVRPGPTVVHHPGVVQVVRPGVRTVRYTHVYPYHGVFVYGPRPVSHVTYVRQAAPGPVQVRQRDLPTRELDRAGSLALGAGVGGFLSTDDCGCTSPGLQVFGRYRPAEALGLELGVGHYNGVFSTDEVRSQTQVGGQAKLFAFPWSHVSPYALVGGMYNVRNVQSELLAGDTSVDTYRSGQWGLDGGVGLELALGESLALDLEGKYVGWMGRAEGEAPGAFMANAGLAFHFR